METTVHCHGLSLAYRGDYHAIAALDQEQVFEDLAEAACDSLVFKPERWRLVDHDHLVLVRAGERGRCLGLLAASSGETGMESFLHIDTAFVPPGAGGLELFQRMLAVMMLRIAGSETVPRVISACTGSPLCLQALRRMIFLLPEAHQFPQPDCPVVPLPTAAIARRIARQIAPRERFHPGTGRLTGPREQVLALLDLLDCTPEAVVQMARAICRTRPRRAMTRQCLNEAEGRMAAGA
jgi:hypothetical protein